VKGGTDIHHVSGQ